MANKESATASFELPVISIGKKKYSPCGNGTSSIAVVNGTSCKYYTFYLPANTTDLSVEHNGRSTQMTSSAKARKYYVPSLVGEGDTKDMTYYLASSTKIVNNHILTTLVVS